MKSHPGSNGYLITKCPVDHPYMRKDGNIMVHRLVMENHIKRYLLPTEIVHHINGIKTDNRIENLKLCSSNAEHFFLHRVIRFDKCKCGCGEIVFRKKSKVPVPKYVLGHFKRRVYTHPSTGKVISRQRWHIIKKKLNSIY